MKLEINTDALGRDIDSLKTLSKNLKSDLQQLTASMEALNTSWEGTAKTAYMLQYRLDQSKMQQLCNTLDDYIKTLEYAKTQYQNGDNQVKSAVSQIRI